MARSKAKKAKDTTNLSKSSRGRSFFQNLTIEKLSILGPHPREEERNASREEERNAAEAAPHPMNNCLMFIFSLVVIMWIWIYWLIVSPSYNI